MTEIRRPHPLAFIALLVGNAALAFGPWLVRLADTGAVAAGFWRLTLALPILLVLARATGQSVHWPRRAIAIAIVVGAFFYAADLAIWNAGIRLTKLGNSSLFGNFASFGFAAYGLWLVRRWPSRMQAAALLLAVAGTALLMASSYELDVRYLRGDVLTLVAGLLYTGYLIVIDKVRTSLPPLPILFLSSLFSAAMLLPTSLLLGERIMPHDWTPLLILAVSSQVIGQGLLVYAIGIFPPLVVGVALLSQPAISALIGWIAYGERLNGADLVGMVAIAAALVLVRLQPGRRGAS